VSLFGAIVKTVVNVVTLPVAVVKDVVTLGNIASGDEPYTIQKIEQIKKEANEE
jgi:hypothetical protein